MKYILLTFFLFFVHAISGRLIQNKLGECSHSGIHCSSCNEVTLCAATEYGLIKQHITTCPEGQHCASGQCSKEKNPLCDGTADIPFHCHNPGVFPDPFDCHYYHLCVVIFQNETDLILQDYKTECQSDNGQAYGFDAKTLTCSEQLGPYGECNQLPIPPCFMPGQTTYVERNRNIYFVCEKVGDVIYPEMFACPFGQQYYPLDQQCMFRPETTTEATTIWTTEATTIWSTTARPTTWTTEPRTTISN